MKEISIFMIKGLHGGSAKIEGNYTAYFICAFTSHVLIVQFSDLSLLPGGEW